MKLVHIFLIAVLCTLTPHTIVCSSNNQMKDIVSALNSRNEQKIDEVIRKYRINVKDGLFPQSNPSTGTQEYLSFIGLATILKCSAGVQVALKNDANPNVFYIISPTPKEPNSALAAVYTLMLKNKDKHTKQIAINLLKAGGTCPEEQQLISEHPDLKKVIEDVKKEALQKISTQKESAKEKDEKKGS